MLGACALAPSRAPAHRVERRPRVPRCPGKRRETEKNSRLAHAHTLWRGVARREWRGFGLGRAVMRASLVPGFGRPRETPEIPSCLLPTLPKHTMSPGTERHHDTLLLSPERDDSALPGDTGPWTETRHLPAFGLTAS